MGSQHSQPDPDPDETRDESTESGPTEDTAASQSGGLPLSRRATLASVLGIGGLSLGLASPAGAQQFTAGRYLELDRGTLNFTGPAEWENAGQFTNTASGLESVVVGGVDNTATDRRSFVGGGSFNDATGRQATVAGGGDNTASGNEATVAGGFANRAEKQSATVAGGQRNKASGSHATVSGGGGDPLKGNGNTASGSHSTVAGGAGNKASSTEATVAGGGDNLASGQGATVAGGKDNEANHITATVSGGGGNLASGLEATVPGGKDNIASGENSFAAGQNAEASNDGAFVWSDSSNTTFSSTGDDQFLIEADGGVGIGTNTPDTQLDVDGDARVRGAVSIGELGASAELTSDLPIADTPTDVVYDSEVVDDRDEYDPSTGVFTCANPGAYHVEAQVIWKGTPSEGEFIRLAIRVNGSTSIADGQRWPTSTTGGETITQSVSGTLRNLSSGDTINITAQTGDDSTTHNLRGLGRGSNLQISQIG